MILIGIGSVIPLAPVTIAEPFYNQQQSTTCGVMSWKECAMIGWRYFMPYPGGTLQVSTGLHGDSYSWHWFTLWGLASYIIAMVYADDLGIIDADHPFQWRASKVLTFLNQEQLTDTGVPFQVYDATTGLPAKNLDPNVGPTNRFDYGRLLIALYLLKQHAIAKGYSDIAAMSDSAATRIDSTKILKANSAADSFYSYYAFQGYRLWGRQDVDISWLDLVYKNGQWADPSKLYGVSGLPLTLITSEPIFNMLLDLNPSSNFLTFAQRVYEVQECVGGPPVT